MVNKYQDGDGLDFTQWSEEPHKKVYCMSFFLAHLTLSVYCLSQVPFQTNYHDCGVFTLLFIYHLRFGELNNLFVPSAYRFDMNGALEGRVGGNLNGMRLTLVEEILTTARRTLRDPPQAITTSASQDSDDEVEIVEPF